MKQIFLILSIIICMMSPTIGIYSILKGKFKPQRMTRFLLLLVSFLFMGTLLAQGDRNAIYSIFVIFLGNLIIFLLSIKRGIGGTTKLDYCVLSMAILSLIIWRVSNNPVLGLTMSIITNFIAFLHTISKSWTKPETEEWRVYAFYVLASIFTILSLSSYTYGKLASSVYVIFMNGTIASLIIFRKKYLKNNHS